MSLNLTTATEIHGEYAIKDETNSYLAGLKYASSYDLTLTSEYYKTYEQKKFFYNKLNQKEPFGAVYTNLYLNALYNLSDKNRLFRFGGNYDFRNNLKVDASLAKGNTKEFAEIKWQYYF